MAKAKTRTFGQVIRDRRRQLDLTQAEVAGRINTSTPYVGHLESGKRHPSEKIVTKLADVLRLDRREIFFLANPSAKTTLFQEPQGGNSALSAWDEFRKEDSLRRIHSISEDEIDRFSHVARMGDARNSPHVFVSYSHADREFAQKLIAELRDRGIAVDPTSETPHDKNWTHVESAIKAADAIIVVVGARDEPEDFQRREWQAALEEIWSSPTKGLLAVLLDNARTPGFLAGRVAFRMSTGMERSTLNKLIRTLTDPRRRSRSVSIDQEHSRERSERLDYIGKVATSLKE